MCALSTARAISSKALVACNGRETLRLIIATLTRPRSELIHACRAPQLELLQAPGALSLQIWERRLAGAAAARVSSAQWTTRTGRGERAVTE
eukprot:6208206-Pleurochrysis_carterae.AAC.2